MTISDSCQVLKTLSVILLCGVLSLSAVTLTHSVNATLLKVQEPLADVHASVAPEILKLNSAIDGLNRVSGAATGLLRAANPVVKHLQKTEDTLDASIDLTTHRLDDLCPGQEATGAAVRPCGTLADANRTLATLRGTSGQVELSLRMFNQHESTLFDQENASYVQFQKSMVDLDALVSNPDYAAIVANGRIITANVAAATTDGRNYLHLKLFPTKKRGFLTGLDAAGDHAHHWLPPLF